MSNSGPFGDDTAIIFYNYTFLLVLFSKLKEYRPNAAGAAQEIATTTITTTKETKKKKKKNKGPNE